MDMQDKLKIFVDQIDAAQSIAIVGHRNPDGDALCSVLALARLIEINYGKQAVCIYDGNIPDNLDGVPLRDNVVHCTRAPSAFDLVIVLDYGTAGHLEFALPMIAAARFSVEIDHHKNDAPIAKLDINDVNAAATGEIIYKMMQDLSWRWDADVLNLLAIAILTDTGFFKFARRGDALFIMGQLVDAGVNIGQLWDSLNNYPRHTVVVEADAVARAEFLYRGRLAIAIVPKKDYKKLDGRGDTILNLLRQIRGVDYIVLLKQQRENQIGISLRSSRAPIDHIAAAFGGGGHMRAAGAVATDTLENVRGKIIEMFKGILG